MTREEAMIEALKRYPTEMMNEMFGPSKDVNDRDREKFIEGALWASSLSPRWVKASERLPPIGIYCALYNGDHVVLQVHDGGFRIVFYNGELEDVPKISLVKWLDESGISEVEELKRVTALLKAKVLQLPEGYVRMENSYIKCPQCGEDWNVTKYNACQCGALLARKPMNNNNH